MTYKDMTFCGLECKNMECKRNQKHIPNGEKYVSIGFFINCNKREYDEKSEKLTEYEKKLDEVLGSMTKEQLIKELKECGFEVEETE